MTVPRTQLLFQSISTHMLLVEHNWDDLWVAEKYVRFLLTCSLRSITQIGDECIGDMCISTHMLLAEHNAVWWSFSWYVGKFLLTCSLRSITINALNAIIFLLSFLLTCSLRSITRPAGAPEHTFEQFLLTCSLRSKTSFNINGWVNSKFLLTCSLRSITYFLITLCGSFGISTHMLLAEHNASILQKDELFQFLLTCSLRSITATICYIL